MEVILVQHGAAKPKDEDPRRPLTDEAREAAGRVGAWGASRGLNVTQVWHSNRLRAEQTAEILADHLRPGWGRVVKEFLGPNDDVHPLAQSLVRCSSGDTVMVVGHLPHLGRLAGLLVCGDEERSPIAFVNGGLVCLVRRDGSWLVSWSLLPDQVR